MATEVLIVPERHLANVIAVLRAGVNALDERGHDLPDDLRGLLRHWCDTEEDYLKGLAKE